MTEIVNLNWISLTISKLRMKKQNRQSHRTFWCQSVAWELPAGDFNFLNRIPNSHHCQNTRFLFEIGPCSYCSLFILFSKDVQQWILFDNKEKLVCENKTVDRKTRCALYQTTRHSLALKQSLEIALVIYLLVLIFRFFIRTILSNKTMLYVTKIQTEVILKILPFFLCMPTENQFYCAKFSSAKSVCFSTQKFIIYSVFVQC